MFGVLAAAGLLCQALKAARLSLRAERIADNRKHVPLGLPASLIGVEVLALARGVEHTLRVRVLVTPALRAERLAEDAVLARHGVEPLTRLLNQLRRRLGALRRLLLADRLAKGKLASVKLLADDFSLELALSLALSLDGKALCRLGGRLALTLRGVELLVPVAPRTVHEAVIIVLEERVECAVARAEARGVPHFSGESSVHLRLADIRERAVARFGCGKDGHFWSVLPVLTDGLSLLGRLLCCVSLSPQKLKGGERLQFYSKIRGSRKKLLRRGQGFGKALTSFGTALPKLC